MISAQAVDRGINLQLKLEAIDKKKIRRQLKKEIRGS
jgi:hypothetical protein